MMNPVNEISPQEYRQKLNDGASKLSDLYAAAFFGETPKVAVIAGSGLGLLADSLLSPKSIGFENLGLPGAKVLGHSGEFVAGKLGDVPVLVQKGRIHMYEGNSGALAALPIRMMINSGVRTILITNAAGALSPDLKVGDLVLISSFDLQALTPDYHPSTGLSGDGIGEQFYAPSHGYSDELMKKITSIAKEEEIPLHKGQYVFRFGPNYEEVADIWELYQRRQNLIAQGKAEYAPASIGMSTVSEFLAIAQWNAQNERVNAAYISNLTNPGAGLSATAPTHEEVMRDAVIGGQRIQKIIERLVSE